jgi:hypothetical protein
MTTPMLNLELHLRIVGVLLLALAVLNCFVPRRFGWPAELRGRSLLLRQVFSVHSFFIILVLVMMGILSLLFAPALLERTALAPIILGGLAIFWTTRLVFQFFVYSPELWRGNRFNTRMHIVFSGMWMYFAAVYATAFFGAFKS